MEITDSVRIIPGVGEKFEKKLNLMGIYNLQDLLYTLPRRYKDFSEIKKLSEVAFEQPALMRFVIKTTPKSSVIKKGLVRTLFDVADETGAVQVVYFNQVHLSKYLEEGKEIYVYGRLKAGISRPQISSPEIFFEKPLPFMPVYALKKGISQHFLQGIIRWLLQSFALEDPYSADFLKRYKLIGLNDAIRQIHYPKNLKVARLARNRLVFDELILFNKTLEVLESDISPENEDIMETTGLDTAFAKMLPFSLTHAQKKVMFDIAGDLAGPRYMNRMIQGDVGSGKTVLAFYAIYCAMKNDFQCVLMAPTEILARQHYETAKELFDINSIVLLTGSQTASEKRKGLERIESGSAKILIGTHAILYGKMQYRNLGLIITDEQHRFGVRQRAALAGKKDVHSLIMSATPIPRSLSLVLFGKTDISVVDELPPGRQAISTYIIRKHKYDEMSRFIRSEMDTGRQVFAVCPLIEEDEDGDLKSAKSMFEEMKNTYAGYTSAMLHGKLKDAEKQNIMEEFAAGEIQMIVSTTVIEVGINVPNATVMCILNAERFGLAQLHQLRGRVGRGCYKSYCFLVSDNQKALERLTVLCQTQDGFEIAQKDMEFRGTGDVLGTRQHGQSQFAIADMLYDAKMLEYARDVLKEIKDDEVFKNIYQKICILAEEKVQNKVVEIALN